MPEKPTLIDLFAGCGGLTQGFVSAGFDPVLAVDFDLAAGATYAANFGDVVQVGDIGALDLDKVPEADVVVGGPPCQGFSGLGRKDPNDERNGLWRHYLSVVDRARPKVFVIENVARFFASPDFELLRQELATGSLRSYETWTGVIDAADFGVPQHRRRAFVVGSLVGKPAPPKATYLKLGALAGLASPWRTVEDAIGDLPRTPFVSALPERSIEFRGKRVPGPFTGLELHLSRSYEPTSLLRYSLVPPGGNRFDLPDELLFDCWLKKRSGTTDVLGRLLWVRPSVTIRTEFFKPEKGRYLHPAWDVNSGRGENRALTHIEAARLQGFPDHYQWCGTKLEIARQIGNAVPPPLAEAIARQMVRPLLDDAMPSQTRRGEVVQLRLDEGVSEPNAGLSVA